MGTWKFWVRNIGWSTTSSQSLQQFAWGPRDALLAGHPGPLHAPQFAPLATGSPWPQVDQEDGTVFAEAPAAYEDIWTLCFVRCPSCEVRKGPRQSRPGYRKPHKHHLCRTCHEEAVKTGLGHKALNRGTLGGLGTVVPFELFFVVFWSGTL